MSVDNDNMWAFLKHQKSCPGALEDAVQVLLKLTKGKNFSGAANHWLDSLEMIKFVIVCEATALVLSDRWQAFRMSEAYEEDGME